MIISSSSYSKKELVEAKKRSLLHHSGKVMGQSANANVKPTSCPSLLYRRKNAVMQMRLISVSCISTSTNDDVGGEKT
jgi:hypothetical protein